MVTYTDNKKLNKPANGEFPDTWDVPVNQDWDIIDKALGSAVQFTVGASDITLTISDAQNQRIVLTGTPGASRYIIIPFKYLSSTTAVGGMWIVDNQTNADQYVVTEAPGSTGVTVTTGRKALVYSDGTDVRFADETRLIAGTGISVSGSTVSLATPVSVANGGTGLSTLTSGNVLLGNGTSAPTFVAPGTVGNVLTSNGSSWISSAPTGGGGGGITSFTISSATGLSFTPNTLTSPGGTMTMSGTLSVSNGGTGNTSLTGLLKGNGTGAITGGATVNLNSGSTDINGTLSTANGGTGTTTSTGTGSNVLSASPTLTGTVIAAAISASGNVSAAGGFFGSGPGYTSTTGRFSNTSPGSGGQWALELITGGAAVLYVRANGSNATFLQFNSNASVVGSIFESGGGTTYNTTSDYRLKENIENYETGLQEIKKLRPVSYTWKDRPEVGHIYGFIAHEAQPVVPYCVTGEKDAVNKDGTIKPQMIDYAKLVPSLVSAVQQLSSQVDALSAEITALKAKVGP